MWKNVSWTEIAGVIGRTAGTVMLCLATTAFLMYPVVGQLMTTIR